MAIISNSNSNSDSNSVNNSKIPPNHIKTDPLPIIIKDEKGHKSQIILTATPKIKKLKSLKKNSKSPLIKKQPNSKTENQKIPKIQKITKTTKTTKTTKIKEEKLKISKIKKVKETKLKVSSTKKEKFRSEKSAYDGLENKVYPPNKYKSMKKAKPLKADDKSLKDATISYEGENKELKWTFLRHNGVLFPPDYVPHNVPVEYKGEEIRLSGEQEEAASWFARTYGTESYENKTFRENFFRDWKKLLGPKSKIRRLEDVDFSRIRSFLEEDRERKKELRKDPEAKKKIKEEKEWKENTYGYALIDKTRQKVGNYMVELPGLFKGRGKHPKAGTIKKRIRPEDIVINVGRGEKIPKCPVEGHSWGGIVHNNKVAYIARWKDSVVNTIKCVNMHASSAVKCRNDINKYEIARKLKKKIKFVRDKYTSGLNDKDDVIRQRSTAVWIIDKLAIRVGNKKDTSKEADTVGVCTLRVEHIRFLEDLKIQLDFLGKDSIRYLNTVKIDKTVYKNLKRFCKNKTKEQVVFDLLNSRIVNVYLSELSPQLTAKVFRTYNASVVLQNELEKKGCLKSHSEYKKRYFYDEANRQVAILCNHQKSVSKTFGTALDKKKIQLDKYKEDKKEISKKIKDFKGDETKKTVAKKKKTLKNRLKKQKEKIAKMELQIKLKKNTKELALGTSKINYMDPRISAAWCKRVNMPLEKIFAKAVLAKFPWACEVEPDFKF